MRALGILAVVLASGCANYRVSATTPIPVAMPAPTGGVYFTTTTTTGAIFLFAAMMAGTLTEQDAGRVPPPEMAPGRDINEQDCTRPVALTGGNLRCR
jgi:hypothetical protein